MAADRDHYELLPLGERDEALATIDNYPEKVLGLRVSQFMFGKSVREVWPKKAVIVLGPDSGTGLPDFLRNTHGWVIVSPRLRDVIGRGANA